MQHRVTLAGPQSALGRQQTRQACRCAAAAVTGDWACQGNPHWPCSEANHAVVQPQEFDLSENELEGEPVQLK